MSAVTNIKNKLLLKIAVLISVLGCPSIAMAAGEAPDAGSLLNELETERRITMPPKKPEVDLQYPKLALQGSEERILVKGFVFDIHEAGLLKNKKFHRLNKETLLDTINKEAHKIADKEKDKELTFNELVKIAEKVTVKIRNMGYPTAVVYIPKNGLEEQTGKLHFRVVSGTYDEIVIENKSQLTDKVLRNYTTPVQKDDLIATKPLNKSLLVLNDLPGIRVKANLAAGDRFGTAKLLLHADNIEKQGASLFADNFGNKSTGRYRYGANYHYNNLGKNGDQLQGNYLISNHKDLKNYSFQYQLPLNRHGMNWRASISRMDYEFVGASGMNYYGDSTSFETGLELPYDRNLMHSNYVNLSFVQRRISDFAAVMSKKSSEGIIAAARGYKRSSRDTFSYNISNIWGRLHMENDFARSTDIMEKEGSFTHGNLELLYYHHFSPVTSLQITASGQTSWGTLLDSSEKFYIAGPNGVRAYPSGEASGDAGVLASAELHVNTPIKGLQLTAFYDVGYSKDARMDMFGSYNNEYLAGAGLGLVYSKYRDWYCKLEWARPITTKYCKTYGKENNNMMWFRIVKQL